MASRSQQQCSQYDSTFFDYTDTRALKSAEAMLSVIKQYFSPASVADFGCGRGGWLATWKKFGTTEVCGLDGGPIEPHKILISPDEMNEKDLAQPVDLQRRFDLVQSLEVAEHLPPTAAETLVDSLVLHSDVILFSAAPPGQGGTGHLNERSYGYWRDLFAARNYVQLDLIRPAVRHLREIEPWYRYNTFVYVQESAYENLPDKVKRTRIAPQADVPDVSSPLFKIRKIALRTLPAWAIDGLSKAKMQLVRAASQRTQQHLCARRASCENWRQRTNFINWTSRISRHSIQRISMDKGILHARCCRIAHGTAAFIRNFLAIWT